MKKKIILLCTAAAMIAVLAVGATLAYLTDTDEATNTFAIGTVEGEVDESSEDPDAPVWITDPKVPILPNQQIVKEPKVKLNGNSSDAFVRVRVTGVDFTLGSTGTEYFIPVNPNIGEGKDWMDGGDGYFYYNYVLSTDLDKTDLSNITTPLFTAVKLRKNIDNSSEEPVIENIIVYADLIQANYLENNATDAQTAFELYEQENVIDVNNPVSNGEEAGGSEGEE